jgi:hypothetical protein
VNKTVDGGDDTGSMGKDSLTSLLGLLVSKMLLYFLCFAFSLSLSTLYWA